MPELLHQLRSRTSGRGLGPVVCRPPPPPPPRCQCCSSRRCHECPNWLHHPTLACFSAPPPNLLFPTSLRFASISRMPSLVAPPHAGFSLRTTAKPAIPHMIAVRVDTANALIGCTTPNFLTPSASSEIREPGGSGVIRLDPLRPREHYGI